MKRNYVITPEINTGKSINRYYRLNYEEGTRRRK
jgi:hypothetical protein